MTLVNRIIRAAKMAQKPSLSYVDKSILAPMVRSGELPLRLLSLEYGADLVYGPEIVAQRIIGSRRTYNSKTGMIEYIKNGIVNFKTCARERNKVIFQLGVADMHLAKQAAETIYKDVAAVDINCGCPKPFSVTGGMGSRLLKTPDKLASILVHLVENIPRPITCKIRLLPDRQETIDLVTKLVTTGISALAVHCRFPDMRSREPALWDRLSDIVEICHSQSPVIPVIINGDLKSIADLERAKKETGADSIMIARAAQFNPSVFRTEGLIEPMEMIRRYMEIALIVDNHASNTKYLVSKMCADANITTKQREMYQKISSSKSNEEMARALGMDLDAFQTEIATSRQHLASEIVNILADEGDDLVEISANRQSAHIEPAPANKKRKIEETQSIAASA